MRKAAWKNGAKGLARPLARMARHWSWKIKLLLDPARRAVEGLRARA
jgi:hypothetical protein